VGVSRLCCVYASCCYEGEASQPMRLPTENKRIAWRSINKAYPLLERRKNRKGPIFEDVAASHPVFHTHSNHILEGSEFSVALCKKAQNTFFLIGKR